VTEPTDFSGERLAPSRLASLDCIRGVAVMGILLMNIVDFAMPGAAYFNPLAYGGSHGANHALWLFNFLLFDGKMRGLFSFLFGASMLIVIEAAETAGRNATQIHFARMGWLLAFGLVHLWLVWDGDILSIYAPVGMAAYAFRKLPPHRLIVIGALLIAGETLLTLRVAYDVHAVEIAAAAPHPSADALKSLVDYVDGFGIPPRSQIAEKLSVARGGYLGLTLERFKDNPDGPLPTLMFVGLETLGYMLLGMALLRNGMLAGRWSRARYRRWLVIGFAVGLVSQGIGALYLDHAHHSTLATVFAAFALPTPFRPFMIIGWACLILLLARPGGALTQRFEAAGRMAFTNYLGTSLICSTLFYGYGFGWFGYLQRAELYCVVVLIWIGMLLWSKHWLAHFRYGPFEWAWRSLARASFQPMRGSAIKPAIENQTQ
jgi:uncharacterized protein